jgi:hypothetical protein
MGGMAEFDPGQPLVHPLPDPERVELRPDLVYAHADGHALAMDAYLPAQRAPGTSVSAVLLVHGEADSALVRGVRGWGQYTGWARLLAGEGMAGSPSSTAPSSMRDLGRSALRSRPPWSPSVSAPATWASTRSGSAWSGSWPGCR